MDAARTSLIIFILRDCDTSDAKIDFWKEMAVAEVQNAPRAMRLDAIPGTRLCVKCASEGPFEDGRRFVPKTAGEAGVKAVSATGGAKA
jgi:hypothetical protein